MTKWKIASEVLRLIASIFFITPTAVCAWYNTLSESYNMLKAKYNELLTYIGHGRAIAESTTPFTGDKRVIVKTRVVSLTLLHEPYA